KRLARGEQAAFAELYDACADRIFHYLMVRLRSHDDAADVLQETFVRLVRTRKRLAKVDNPIAYAFTVARNEAARLAGRQSRETAGRSELVGSGLFVQMVGDDAPGHETADLAAAALVRLDPDHREVLQLKTYAGLTFREIAEVTGLPQGTVATRYRTAIEKLRAWLAKEAS
ncbi:MAG TPA: sigma-70 family RNA polymerase sigma factor, partial [Thermoguttaceae bacterium]|nr:sigma-70 family RNA polymerase sigma factor [Thermoguttaceae bacterium]